MQQIGLQTTLKLARGFPKWITDLWCTLFLSQTSGFLGYPTFLRKGGKTLWDFPVSKCFCRSRVRDTRGWGRGGGEDGADPSPWKWGSLLRPPWEHFLWAEYQISGISLIVVGKLVPFMWGKIHVPKTYVFNLKPKRLRSRGILAGSKPDTCQIWKLNVYFWYRIEQECLFGFCGFFVMQRAGYHARSWILFCCFWSINRRYGLGFLTNL